MTMRIHDNSAFDAANPRRCRTCTARCLPQVNALDQIGPWYIYHSQQIHVGVRDLLSRKTLICWRPTRNGSTTETITWNVSPTTTYMPRPTLQMKKTTNVLNSSRIYQCSEREKEYCCVFEDTFHGASCVPSSTSAYVITSSFPAPNSIVRVPLQSQLRSLFNRSR
ncbi:hypothetical protein BDU57DRAFT_242258 [Ampelomyces quisqualis]|uniref:Uncharacterized protein n=1 Tax=Ampelomyces quisqualis TaxID=50730 RepID=A0A6A5QMR8_AMPQU|nr:hypothetical protein BDU57DRAFT_242258 [Ampelomyces quisqualis]